MLDFCSYEASVAESTDCISLNGFPQGLDVGEVLPWWSLRIRVFKLWSMSSLGWVLITTCACELGMTRFSWYLEGT